MSTSTPLPRRSTSTTSVAEPTVHRSIADVSLTTVAPQRRGVRRRLVSMARTADRTYARLVSACGYDPYA